MKVYIVTGFMKDYEDAYKWVHKVYLNEPLAEQECISANRYIDELGLKFKDAVEDMYFIPINDTRHELIKKLSPNFRQNIVMASGVNFAFEVHEVIE